MLAERQDTQKTLKEVQGELADLKHVESDLAKMKDDFEAFRDVTMLPHGKVNSYLVSHFSAQSFCM